LGFDDASAIGGAWSALGLAVCSHLERERGVVATVAGLAIKSVHEPAVSCVSSVWLGDVVRVELVQVEVHTSSAFLSTTAAHSWMLGAQACPWLSDAVVPALISVGNIQLICIIQVGHVAEASESSASQSAARYWYWTSRCCVTME